MNHVIVALRLVKTCIRDCALCHHGYNRGHSLIFMRNLVTEFDTNSTHTANTTQVPSVTKLVH
jgi:hypothetical protein